MRLAPALLLAALVPLAGCLADAPAAVDPASATEAATAALVAHAETIEFGWSAQTPIEAAGLSLMGTGWPTYDPPKGAGEGNVTFSWAGTPEGGARLRFVRDGDVLLDETFESSPATIALDASMLGKSFMTTAFPAGPAPRGQTTYTLDFVVLAPASG